MNAARQARRKAVDDAITALLKGLSPAGAERIAAGLDEHYVYPSGWEDSVPVFEFGDDYQATYPVAVDLDFEGLAADLPMTVKGMTGKLCSRRLHLSRIENEEGAL